MHRAAAALTGNSGATKSGGAAGQPPLRVSVGEAGPAGPWRPRSPDQGISPVKYVWWNTFYWIMEYANRKLARDPNIKVSWDKWPAPLGLLYLIAKIRFNRSNALTDPYDYKANDTRPIGRESRNAREHYAADGSAVSDFTNPQMGMTGTRMGSNIPPRKVRPDFEQQRPLARDVARLRHRRTDPVTGEDIEVPAGILNILAEAWIEWQFHGFGGLTKRDSISQCPILVPRRPEENWPDNVARIDRTSRDDTRLTWDGRPTPLNERPQAWIHAMVFGGSAEEEARLRTFEGGHMKLGPDGFLPEDDRKPGIDLTGFNNNMTPEMSFLHWLAVKELNCVADWLADFHPDWDDEMLFQEAKRTVCGLLDFIHTTEWTEDLLQHPTLQLAMHADWFGLLGQRRKLFLMRLFDRHPFLNWLGTPLRNNEFIWGMPGSKHEHHDGPFQVPLHFRMTYRLHELVRSIIELFDPETGRSLARVPLLDYIQHNVRPMVQKFGYPAIAYSSLTQSCGALVPHNMATALTRFKNQQDGEWTDLAERDLLRDDEDGAGNYQDFRQSMGEPPVESFLELTAGNAAAAKEVEEAYGGDLDKVHSNIGILYEYKPKGFALGVVQFFQFVLNAPRRIKSNWLLTAGFNYKVWREGMDWVHHSGGFIGMLRRHVAELRSKSEGVVRGFAPWQDTERFPFRLYTDCMKITGDLAKADAIALLMGMLVGIASVWTGAASPSVVAGLLAAYAAGSIALAIKRMLAMRFMQLCWKRCYTDKRVYMFGTLKKAEDWINRSAFFGKLGALAVIAGGGFMAYHTWGANPVISILFGLLALTGFNVRKKSDAFVGCAQLLKIALRNRMREGQPVTDATTLPGETALEKRYWHLKGDNEHPVATFTTCYRALREQGLPPWTAFGTTVLSLVSFARKSQKGLSLREKWAVGIGPFSWFKIYIPGLIHAQGESNTRIYAPIGNDRGIRPGDPDMKEFDFMFARFAPGRDYMTGYDLVRMREANAVRDARAGRGSFVSRLIGRFAAKRRHAQLLALFADRVVEEDRKLVPAISKETFLRVYQGAAQADLLREHQEGNEDPSPIAYTSLEALASAGTDALEALYHEGAMTELPVGETNGRAIILPGTLSGRLLSALSNLIWKGKWFEQDGGLVNKILGMKLVKARVSAGESWSDGKTAIIIDYKNTSLVAFFIRDEIRQVADDIYLGKAYIRLPFGRRFAALFFAVDFRTQ